MLEKSKEKLREERKAAVRAAIKNAALELAEKEGWHNVSIRKIAAKIGYAAPIVYEHFSDKTDLYHQIVSDGFRELAIQTRELIDQKSSPAEVIHAIATSRVRFAENNQTLHFLMFDADNPDWQQVEIYKSMKTVKEAMMDSIKKLSSSPEKAEEYFFNFVCLVSGYTFFQRHLLTGKAGGNAKHILPYQEIEKFFFGSIDRFIESIKKL